MVPLYPKKTLLLLFFVFVTVTILSCDASVVNIELSTYEYDYGVVNLGSSETATFQINNPSNSQITIRDFSFFGVGSADFELISGQLTPIVMSSGRSLTIELEFKPTQDGYRVCDFVIKHTGKTLFTKVNLVGTGLAVPKIAIPEDNWHFDEIYYGTTDSHEFVIENIGTAQLTLSEYQFTGIQKSLYSVSSGGNLPVSILPGETHKMTIEFSPVYAGSFPIRFELFHDAKNMRYPAAIDITSSVISDLPEIATSHSNSWNFGKVATSFPNLQMLEIRSIGFDPLTVTEFMLITGTNYSINSIVDSNGSKIQLPAVINPSDSIFVVVRFEPNKSNAIYSDKLSIAHDGHNESSPITINLSGSGRDPLTKTLNYTGVIENWTIPSGVTTVRIQALGAQGGGDTGGKGAQVRGDFIVTPGETIRIIVGGQGNVTAQGSSYGAGGGGGTFVFRNVNDPLPMLVAAGGGGQAEYGLLAPVAGGDGSYIQTATSGLGTGSGSGGASGNGGNGGSNIGSYSTGGGGCGWLTDGKDGSLIRNPEGEGGKCPKNGAKGGEFTHPTTSYCAGTAGDGGFGGGGGMSEDTGAGGGGGGYNGGGGGNNASSSNSWGSGGGGGSYNNGYNQSGASGVNKNDGSVLITY